MQRRISWKKGMRLTEEVMKASDMAISEWVGNALVLASAGRFGLLPTNRPFRISIDFTRESVEVKSLYCCAVTKGGLLIDINFDTQYSRHFSTSVKLPGNGVGKELLLTIGIDPEQWAETVDGFEEPSYHFDLVSPNSPVPDNAVPIARLVDTDFGGWHVDDADFVPPCLFVASHFKYQELYERFLQALSEVETMVRRQLQSNTRDVIRIFWPNLVQIMIDTDKGRELMTPMTLTGQIQKFVAAFTTACDLDDRLTLSDADAFRNYVLSPYDFKNAYRKIKDGLEFCFSIKEKIGLMEENQEPVREERIAAPYIPADQLNQSCSKRYVTVSIVNTIPEATVFYSTDGGEPTKQLVGDSISIESKFNAKRVSEPDMTVPIKLKAVANGVSSEVKAFTLTLRKDYKNWMGVVI